MLNELSSLLMKNKLAQATEILFVILIPWVTIWAVSPFIENNPLALHGAIWLANVFMLVVVWLGLRLRGQRCRRFGLTFGRPSLRTVVRTMLRSLIVFVCALVAFIFGAVLMANIVGMPQQAQVEGFDYMRGNVPMFIVVLLGVYVVSSFGEEVIYRGFLINRLAELGGQGKWSWRLAVLISSVLFGLIHSDWNITGMVQTGLMGLALGISYLAVERNLWVVVLAHGYADTLLLVQLFLAE